MAEANKKIKVIAITNIIVTLIYNLFSVIFSNNSVWVIFINSVLNHLLSVIFFIFVIIQRKEQIRKDFLTGLSNRLALMEHLQKNKNKKGYLVIADINKFKQINDKYGHLEGDDAIKLIAAAFKIIQEKYSEVFVSRFGGDEFVLAVQTTDEQMLNKIINDLSCLIKNKSKNKEYDLSVSFGYSQLDNGNYKESFKIADMNMYKVKYSNK